MSKYIQFYNATTTIEFCYHQNINCNLLAFSLSLSICIWIWISPFAAAVGMNWMVHVSQCLPLTSILYDVYIIENIADHRMVTAQRYTLALSHFFLSRMHCVQAAFLCRAVCVCLCVMYNWEKRNCHSLDLWIGAIHFWMGRMRPQSIYSALMR